MILPDPFPAFDSSQDDIQEITPERTPEKVLEPEKEKLRTPEKVLEPEKEKTPRTREEKLATGRSMCPRSSTPARPRKRKATKKYTGFGLRRDCHSWTSQTRNLLRMDVCF